MQRGEHDAKRTHAISLPLRTSSKFNLALLSFLWIKPTRH